jgi:hypothetical protein
MQRHQGIGKEPLPLAGRANWLGDGRMSESLPLAAMYFDMDCEDAHTTGYYLLLCAAFNQPDECWPGTDITKSEGNAFTAFLTEPRSSFKFTPKQVLQRQQGARYGDPEKARIFTI